MSEPEIDPNDPPEPFAQTRINICRSCEHYVLMVCKKCGCFMPAKTRIRSARCPLDKWQPVVETN